MRKELDRMTRKRMAQIYARRYRKTTTGREKTKILDEFPRLAGHNRSYTSGFSGIPEVPEPSLSPIPPGGFGGVGNGFKTRRYFRRY